MSMIHKQMTTGRYSDEERDEILAESRATLKRLNEERARAGDPPPPVDYLDAQRQRQRLLDEAMAFTVESMADRHRREIAETDRRCRIMDHGRRKLDTMPVDWVEYVEERVRQAVEHEHEIMVQILIGLVEEMSQRTADEIERAYEKQFNIVK